LEPGHGVAAPLDDAAEQRIIRAVGDAEDGLEVRQSSELGGAGRDGDGDGYTALLRILGWSYTLFISEQFLLQEQVISSLNMCVAPS
jgi:hypothetical protein